MTGVITKLAGALFLRTEEEMDEYGMKTITWLLLIILIIAVLGVAGTLLVLAFTTHPVASSVVAAVVLLCAWVLRRLPR